MHAELPSEISAKPVKISLPKKCGFISEKS